MINILFEEIKKNLRNPRMYAVILTLIVLGLILFPYLDANLFYYKRVSSRIDLLTKISNIDKEKISEDPILYNEYQDILQEISSQPDNMVNHIFFKETRKTVNDFKFISGGFIFWLFAILCLFLKDVKNIAARILGVLFGFIARSISNIFNPWVNCIGFPLVLILVVALLLTSGKKNNDKKL